MSEAAPIRHATAAPGPRRRFAASIFAVIAAVAAITAATLATAQTLTAPADAPAVQQAIDDVLAAPEFKGLFAPPSAWDRFRLWLGELWDDFVRGVNRVANAMPAWLLWLIIIWILLALLAVVIHLIWTLVTAAGGAGRRGAIAAGDREGAFGWLGVREVEFGPLMAAVRRLMDAGDWAAAIRHLYVAGLVGLADRGRIRFHRWATNRDYLDQLAPHPTEHEQLRAMTAIFEPVAYGGRAADRTGCERMAAGVQRLTAGGADHDKG